MFAPSNHRMSGQTWGRDGTRSWRGYFATSPAPPSTIGEPLTIFGGLTQSLSDASLIGQLMFQCVAAV